MIVIARVNRLGNKFTWTFQVGIGSPSGNQTLDPDSVSALYSHVFLPVCAKWSHWWPQLDFSFSLYIVNIMQSVNQK